MPSAPFATSASPLDDTYAGADAAWRLALERYLRLAREGAGAGRLRAAAAEFHAAALRRGRLARPPEDSER